MTTTARPTTTNTQPKKENPMTTKKKENPMTTTNTPTTKKEKARPKKDAAPTTTNPHSAAPSTSFAEWRPPSAPSTHATHPRAKAKPEPIQVVERRTAKPKAKAAFLPDAAQRQILSRLACTAAVTPEHLAPDFLGTVDRLACMLAPDPTLPASGLSHDSAATLPPRVRQFMGNTVNGALLLWPEAAAEIGWTLRYLLVGASEGMLTFGTHADLLEHVVEEVTP